jgi:16S rRNA (cytidine1402-2'-O)-methyltransferase
MAGALYLIPSFLSDDMKDILPSSQMEIVRNLDEFIVEEPKTARQFLKKIGTVHPLPSIVMHTLNEHTAGNEIEEYLATAKTGKSIGLISEAGCPAVADPGSNLIRLAHKLKIPIKPMIGPSSILLALMASGLNGQSFCFHGYLPRDQSQRKKRLIEIEKDAVRKNQSQIFIETPYRNQQLITDVFAVCHPDISFCIASDLTSQRERITTKTISEWRKTQIQLDKIPAIFILGN